MIPYETVRHHLQRRHWASTDGFTWEQLVAIHDEVHRHPDELHHDSAPPIQPHLYPVIVDVPVNGELL